MAEQPIRIRNFEQSVAAVPYLLGFQPKDSLIAVFMNDHRVALTARWDLADVPTNAAAAELVDRSLARPINDGSFNEAILMTWREAIDMDADRDVLAGLGDRLESKGILVKDTLVTDGQTVRSTMCGDPACRCSTGVQVTQAIRDSVASEFVGVGDVVAKDRDSLIQEWASHEVAPHLQEAAELGKQAMSGGLDGMSDSDRRALLADVQWMTAAMTGPTLPASTSMNVARLIGKAATDVRVRDALVVEICELSGSDLAAYANNARGIALALPDDTSSIAATLAGTAHWMTGDGVRASRALDHALATNPNNRLADLMTQAYSQGMAPTAFRDTVQGGMLNAASMLNIHEPALASAVPAGPTTAGPSLDL